MEIVQGNLTRNFSILLKRLNHHDALLAQYQLVANQHQADNINQLLRLEQQLLDYKSTVTDQLQEAFQKSQTLEDKFSSLKGLVDENIDGIKRVNE